MNESGAAYLTPSLLKGRQMIRVSIGAERTERRHVEAVWAALQQAARSQAWVGLPKDEDLVEVVEAEQVSTPPAEAVDAIRQAEPESLPVDTEPMPIDTTAELLGRRTRKPRARMARAAIAPGSKKTATKKPTGRRAARGKKSETAEAAGDGE